MTCSAEAWSSAARGLVAEKEFRPRHQSPGNGHTLLLSPGEGPGEVPEAIPQPQPLQRSPGHPEALPPPDPPPGGGGRPHSPRREGAPPG